MPPRTEPCGTPAAAVFHKRHGEPVDDACAQALARYKTVWTRQQRAQAPIAECTGCGRERPIRVRSRGWCGSCDTRWHRAGKPADGPPPLPSPEDLRAARTIGPLHAWAARQLDAAIRRGGWEWAA
jgi:hypothetical protein